MVENTSQHSPDPGEPESTQRQDYHDAHDSPLDNFSHCHDGILSHLDMLCELPALVVAALQGKDKANHVLRFFAEAMQPHHEEEERELFTAVMASAEPGDEAARVQALIDQLTREHRVIEDMWDRLAPQLKRLANAHIAPLDGDLAVALIEAYKRHAAFEEQEFLPLCQTILGRKDSHMAALGLSLHMRHVPMKLPHM